MFIRHIVAFSLYNNVVELVGYLKLIRPLAASLNCGDSLDSSHTCVKSKLINAHILRSEMKII